MLERKDRVNSEPDNSPPTPTHGGIKTFDQSPHQLETVGEDAPSVNHHPTIDSTADLQNTSKFNSSINSSDPKLHETPPSNIPDSETRLSQHDSKPEQTSPRSDQGTAAGFIRQPSAGSPDEDLMYRQRSEKLCWGIFGSVILSLAVGSILLYAYATQLTNYIDTKAQAGAEAYVLLFFLAYIGTQPMFPGLT
jgi:hypothetical protein